MRARIIAGAAASAAVLALAVQGPEPATDPGYGKNADMPHAESVLNGSSDGRFHTCGYVTEDGVTEYIDAYLERCGDETLAGDSPKP